MYLSSKQEYQLLVDTLCNVSTNSSRPWVLKNWRMGKNKTETDMEEYV
jgi:hypothetical protein